MPFNKEVHLLALSQKQDRIWHYVCFTEQDYCCTILVEGTLLLRDEYKLEAIAQLRNLRRKYRVRKLWLTLLQEQVAIYKVYLDFALNPLQDRANILVAELDLEQTIVLQDYFYDYQALSNTSGIDLQAYQLALLPKNLVKPLLQIFTRAGFKLINLQSRVFQWESMNLLPWRVKLQRQQYRVVLMRSLMLPLLIFVFISSYRIYIEYSLRLLWPTVQKYQDQIGAASREPESDLSLAAFNKAFALQAALPIGISLERASLAGSEWQLSGSLTSLNRLPALSEELFRLGFITAGKSPSLSQQGQHYVWFVNE